MYADKIDCVSDPCHLAWLIRDNRNLLKVVGNGRCTDGKRFEDIDPNTFFSSCESPVTLCPSKKTIASFKVLIPTGFNDCQVTNLV